MKWKSDVSIKENQRGGYSLVRNDIEVLIDQKYNYLIRAIQTGDTRHQELVELIMKEEHLDESAAGFELAGFIIKYGDYIAENQEYYEIQY